MTGQPPIDVRVDTSEFDEAMREMSANAEAFGRSLVGAFRQVAVAGGDLDEVLRGLVLRFADLALNQALAPLEDAIGGIFSQLAPGAAKSATTPMRPTSISFNVVTQNAQSFARSQSQISGMLARAVARGNRIL